MRPWSYRPVIPLQSPDNHGDSAVRVRPWNKSSKPQAMYEQLFVAISGRCEQLAFQLDPSTVITDFEQAVFGAVGKVVFLSFNASWSTEPNFGETEAPLPHPNSAPMFHITVTLVHGC